MGEEELDGGEGGAGILEAAEEEGAFERADDKLSEFEGLGARIDFAAGDALGGDFGGARGPTLQGFFCAGAGDGGAVGGFGGGGDEGTAAGGEAVRFFGASGD